MPTIRVNGELRDVVEGTSVEGLLAALDIATAGVAVELNREIVPKSRHASTGLKDGDTVEIVRMTGGG